MKTRKKKVPERSVGMKRPARAGPQTLGDLLALNDELHESDWREAWGRNPRERVFEPWWRKLRWLSVLEEETVLEPRTENPSTRRLHNLWRSLGLDRAAWRYEMARRANDTVPLILPPWPLLPPEDRLIYEAVLAPRYPDAEVALYCKPQDVPPGYMAFPRLPGGEIVFKLDAPDCEIEMAFMRLIYGERERLGIAQREPSQIGKPKKRPDWSVIERLDGVGSEHQGIRQMESEAQALTGPKRLQLEARLHPQRARVSKYQSRDRKQAESILRSIPFLAGISWTGTPPPTTEMGGK